MNEPEYISIKIPKYMGDVLDRHMKNATMQYSSRAELVKEILRKHFNNGNGGNGAFSTTTQTSDPISPPTKKTEKKRS